MPETKMSIDEILQEVLCGATIFCIKTKEKNCIKNCTKFKHLKQRIGEILNKKIDELPSIIPIACVSHYVDRDDVKEIISTQFSIQEEVKK